MEWIKCSDRLPDDCKPVLAVWMGQTQDVTFIHDDGVWFGYDPFDDNYRGEEVTDCHLTHWQPLPDPPKDN